MAVIFFDNIYYSDTDAIDNSEFEQDPFEEVNLSVSQEDITEYKHTPYKSFFSLIYRFSEHFSLQSMTRKCAWSIEESEYSVLNLVEAQNPTLISYSRLTYYMLSHVYSVVEGCSKSVKDELSEAKTYVALGDYDEVISTVDYWLQQDQRVFNNIQEVITLAHAGHVDYD